MEHDRDYFNDIPIEIKNNPAVFYDALNAYYPAETIFPYTKDYRTAGNSLGLKWDIYGISNRRYRHVLWR